MLAPPSPSPVLRRARADEVALLNTLHLSSLWCVELEGQRMEAASALARTVPSVDAALVETGAYVVAEAGGEIRAGGGWAPVPDHLGEALFLDGDGRPVRLRVSPDAALVRAFFCDPEGGSYGVRRRVMARLEGDAAAAGYGALEIVTSHGWLASAWAMGFRPMARLGLPLPGGGVLPLLHLRKGIACGMARAA